MQADEPPSHRSLSTDSLLINYVPRMRKRCGWVGNILRRPRPNRLPRLYRDEGDTRWRYEVKVLSGCVALVTQAGAPASPAGAFILAKPREIS